MFKKVGRFLGTIEDAGFEITSVNEEGKGGLPVWSAFLKPHSELVDGEFREIENDDIIRVKLYLYGHNGEPTFQCQHVADATGWNGRSFQTLNTMDYEKVGDVQFAIEEEEYTDNQGDIKTNHRVQWVQTPTYEPQGIRRATDAEAKAADKKFNKFKPKKNSSAAKPSTPAKPKSNPKTSKTNTSKGRPTADAKPKPNESKNIPEAIAKTYDDPDAAWDAVQMLVKQSGEIVDDEIIETAWFDELKGNTEDKGYPESVDDYTPEQLGELVSAVVGRLSIPF